MKSLFHAILLAIPLHFTAATAEVTDTGVGGFVTVNEVIIDASREVVWKSAINQVGHWWSSDHTVAGDASRLTIQPVTQGCFCERFDSGGGVVHMTVTMVNPGVVIRLTGGLGPLGLMGVSGNMTWEFQELDDGTKVTFIYAVGGYLAGGLDAVAGPVDDVVGEALHRLRAHVENGDADTASIE